MVGMIKPTNEMKRSPDGRVPTIGWGPWRKEWYSICSGHYLWNEECSICNVGRWVNVWRHAVGHVIYRVAPGVWRWWANREKMWWAGNGLWWKG